MENCPFLQSKVLIRKPNLLVNGIIFIVSFYHNMEVLGIYFF
jgi:hypothetical protein